MNEDVAAPDPGGVDEVVALRDEVDDVLPRVVGRRDDEVLLVLHYEDAVNIGYSVDVWPEIYVCTGEVAHSDTGYSDIV